MVTNITFWSESVAFPLLTTLTIVPLAAMSAILFSRSTTVALGLGFAGTLLNLFLSFYLLTLLIQIKLEFNWPSRNISLVL